MSGNWSDLVNIYLKRNKSVENESVRQRSSQLQKLAFGFAPKPVMKYLPSYRLEPKVPLNRETCENIMKNVMDNVFEHFVYTPKASLNLCTQVSEEIKNRIKNENFDRYRFIVIVTIGEKLYQGYYSLVNFLWDADKDGYLSYVHDKPRFFASATVYYLYYD